MATYEFQISVTPDNYQAQSSVESQHLSHQPGLSVAAGSGPVEPPEPVIIHYDANHTRPPYGSGDEGFDLTFHSLEAFFAWKESEESKNCVDYFKVDAHHSKAVPPRFLEHVKLACSRHTRSGQKKYERKFPERQRKTPSKKACTAGCPSSISYKTYVNTPIVKVNCKQSISWREFHLSVVDQISSSILTQ
ncbi:hypothetical protein M408DRAFT_59905 [Serendipita vermifera MAFF 305830]|uniref:Uncharacterized protein n=1 Tax=Serendipita vermifera MAFF 305830 TaxID=933852 RepID=A0A0C3BQY9_SERVB|nr:hypothetical protein M408DRAFT_59905 [Serendipita vermifera MAFF 305830]